MKEQDTTAQEAKSGYFLHIRMQACRWGRQCDRCRRW